MCFSIVQNSVAVSVFCMNQSSHASWKVLDCFLENSRTWKITLVLENSRKISLKVMHFSTGSN